MEPETEKTGIPDGGARRGRLLMLLLLLWLIAAAVQAVRLGVFQRDELRQLSGKIALERGVLAAPRGRLLDADGVEALAAAEGAGEMKIRVTGRYDSFDITFPRDSLAGVSLIGRLAEEI